MARVPAAGVVEGEGEEGGRRGHGRVSRAVGGEAAVDDGGGLVSKGGRRPPDPTAGAAGDEAGGRRAGVSAWEPKVEDEGGRRR